jgi:hypothetical protein
MTAKNERIRRERELIHARELLRRRAPDASEPAISRSLRLKLQAGISDFIRLTWTRDSISFLVNLVLCLTLQALRDDSLYDIFQKVVRQQQ